MFSTITKIWLFVVAAVVLALSLLFSAVLFISILALLVVSLPYFLYLKWKAKKELDNINQEWIDVEFTCETEKKLKDRF